jgi:hypothetical protein
MRFYHKIGIGKKERDLVDDALEIKFAIKRSNLMGAFSQALSSGDLETYKQVLDKVLESFLIDYLLERGVFRKK